MHNHINYHQDRCSNLYLLKFIILKISVLKTLYICSGGGGYGGGGYAHSSASAQASAGSGW